MTSNIRVPLVVPGTDPALAEIERCIVAERGRVSLLYQALLNSGPLAAGWEKLLTAVRKESTVPAHLRELAILRVAVLNGARFEFEAHVPHAHRAGVSQDKIDALTATVLARGDVYTEDERLVLELTDTMTRDIVVPEHLMQALTERYDPRTLVEMVATVAAYNMVSRFLVAFNIGH
ncbi:MAG: carboxymuconolactone decarboxylase family protein [Pseudomonadota bacterium]|nr:carboxymuconolactone decarboxylase family protein [Pseudomonadota bacterium]